MLRRIRWFTRRYQAIIAWLILVLCIAAVPAGIWWRKRHRENMRATALPITISRSIPIIEAIRTFQRKTGKLPETLDALVPTYLARLPDAGPAAKDGWRFDVDDYGNSGGWALYIRVRDEYSPNIMGFGDTFVYHPSGQYPIAGYGGMLVRFGGWGYYVE